MTGPQISHREPDDDPGPDRAAPDAVRDEGDPADVRNPGPGLLRTDPLAPLATCPPFRPDTAGLGPFDNEPFELLPVMRDTRGGHVRPGHELHRCLGEWLTGALDAAEVTLGAFDRLQVHLIAQDGWGPVQTVAGWITRARNANPPQPAAEPDGAQRHSGPDPPDANP